MKTGQVLTIGKTCMLSTQIIKNVYCVSVGDEMTVTFCEVSHEKCTECVGNGT